jgi:hypothetical protein
MPFYLENWCSGFDLVSLNAVHHGKHADSFPQQHSETFPAFVPLRIPFRVYCTWKLVFGDQFHGSYHEYLPILAKN